MPIMDHLGELRRRLTIVVVSVIVCALVVYFATPTLIELMMGQIEEAMRGQELVVMSVLGGFTIRFKVALFFSVIVCSPIIIWEVLAFFLPALKPKERRWVVPTVAAMVFLIWVGMALGTREAWAKFACFCVAVGFIFLAHPALLPPHLIVDRTPVDFIVRESRRALTPETLVLADSGMASATAWALRRADIGIYGNPGEFAAGMESAGPGRFYSQDRLAAIIQSGVQPVLIVTDSEKLVREMPAALEKSYRRRGGLFIIHYRKQGEANL